jgi:NADPH-dependent curcumin reductase CurA
MQLANEKVVLKQAPDGVPTPDDFAIVSEAVGEPADGEIVIEVEYLGIDAFITTTLNHDGHHGRSEVDTPVMALGTGRVIESRSDAFAPGDRVFGGMGAQRYKVTPVDGYRKLDESSLPSRTYLGLLGITTGLTAYAGMILVGDVKEGDTVAVSAAAGAVGSIACQLAKLKGARVIGIAGGPEKCTFLQELNCDATIDYKSSNVAEQLGLLAPDGLDLFFDNVGGDILDAALDNLAMGARVVICGAISQYADLAAAKGPALYLRLAERNATMSGFTVDYYQDQFPEMEANLTQWANEGKIHMQEHIESGLERFPDALEILFKGGHRGKLLLTP